MAIPSVDEPQQLSRRSAERLHQVPVAQSEAERDVRCAQRAVIVHAPQDWPTGRKCRNCSAKFPCPVQVWGFGTLVAAGWNQADIADLVRRTERGEIRW